jgi:hypothetical protein
MMAVIQRLILMFGKSASVTGLHRDCSEAEKRF